MTVHVVTAGDLVFVYGTPRDLVEWSQTHARDLVFKYWIALDIADEPRAGFLKPTHRGLLLYCKPGTKIKTVRIPHAQCSACGRTLKDWGGKKHLMHPRGAALSDVWRDLPRRRLTGKIPADVLRRIQTLAGNENQPGPSR